MHARLDAGPSSDKALILSKAIKRLAIELDLTQKELYEIIGPSEATFSRMFKNGSTYSVLDPVSKEGENAILLLRLYKNLDVLFGGNAKQCQLWLRSDNKHLGNKPIDLIKLTEGLVVVVQYLDAMRGKS